MAATDTLTGGADKVRFDVNGELVTPSIRIDDTMARDAATAKYGVKADGIGNAQVSDSQIKYSKYAIVAATGGGGALNVQGGSDDVILLNAMVNIESATGVAATINLGLGALATTDYDTIIDGADANAVDLYNHRDDKGTNGLGKPQIWAAGEYLSATISAGPGAISGQILIQTTNLQTS